MSAELLRRAAKTLRHHATIATKSEPEIPWTAYRQDEPARHVVRVDCRWRDEDEAMPSGYTVADMSLDAPAEAWPLGQAVVDAQYIALMHPPVALALADWLDAAAVVLNANYGNEVDLLAEIDDDQTAQNAVIVARAILREDS